MKQVSAGTSLEATQVSTAGWIEKHNVICSYDGVVFSFKKQGNSDTCDNINES